MLMKMNFVLWNWKKKYIDVIELRSTRYSDEALNIVFLSETYIQNR
jgi:hypothetical protein